MDNTQVLNEIFNVAASHQKYDELINLYYVQDKEIQSRIFIDKAHIMGVIRGSEQHTISMITRYVACNKRRW